MAYNMTEEEKKKKERLDALVGGGKLAQQVAQNPPRAGAVNPQFAATQAAHAERQRQLQQPRTGVRDYLAQQQAQQQQLAQNQVAAINNQRAALMQKPAQPNAAFDAQMQRLGLGANRPQSGILNGGLTQQVAKAPPKPTANQINMQAAAQRQQQQRAATAPQQPPAAPLRQSPTAAQQMATPPLAVTKAQVATTAPAVVRETQKPPVIVQEAPTQVVAPPKEPKPTTVNDLTSAQADKAAAPVYAEDTQPISSEQGSKKFGLSLIPNSLKTAPANTLPNQTTNAGFGAVMPQAPRKEYGEDSRRQVLAADIKPYEGMSGLTTKQAEAKARILFGDDAKFANDQYNTQMDVYKNLTQSQMGERGALDRAQLEQAGLDSRLEAQLGFDQDKLNQGMALEQAKLGLQATEGDLKALGAKRLDSALQRYDDAQTPEDKLAAQEYINTIRGGANGSGSSASNGIIKLNQKTTAIDGTSTSEDVGYNPKTGQWLRIPQQPRSIEDGVMQEAAQSGKYSDAELAALANAYLSYEDLTNLIKH